jgi:hypothetical protein
MALMRETSLAAEMPGPIRFFGQDVMHRQRSLGWDRAIEGAASAPAVVATMAVRRLGLALVIGAPTGLLR